MIPEVRTPGSEEAAALVARANLARLRGQWAEATTLCTAAIRADPSNASACSLLGDVYFEQGRPEEAEHWYSVALEIQPDNPADRGRLERVRSSRDVQRLQAEWEAVVEGRVRSLPRGDVVRETVLRVATIVGTSLCAIVLVMAVIVSLMDPVGGTGATANLPTAVPPPAGSSSGTAFETTAEQDLYLRLRQAMVRSMGQVVRLELDPRDQSATLRIVVPASIRDRLQSAPYRLELMREGYRFAWKLAELDRSLKSVHLRVIRPDGATRTATRGEVELLAAVPCDSAVTPERATPTELEQLYSALGQPLWAPGLR